MIKKKKTATTKKSTAKKAAKKPATKKTAKKTAAKKKAATSTKKAAKKTAKKATKAPAKKATKKTAKKAAKKVAKKAAKKVAKKAASTKKAAAPKAAAPKVTPAIALPARKLPDTSAWNAPASAEAVATLVPVPRDDEEVDDDDDALEAGLGAAFDGVFNRSPARAARSTEPFVAGDPSEDLAQACAAIALDKKADDVVILRVAELTSYADFFVIAAAPSERQVQAIARTVADELKQRGRVSMSTDGMDQGNWVIVDYGSVVLHVFLQSARRYYDLDGFWVDAPRVEVDEGRGQGALQSL